MSFLPRLARRSRALSLATAMLAFGLLLPVLAVASC